MSTDLTFFTNKPEATLAGRSAKSLFENFYDCRI